jgi:hypothetical protein
MPALCGQRPDHASPNPLRIARNPSDSRIDAESVTMANIALTIFYRFPVKPAVRGKGGPDPLS